MYCPEMVHAKKKLQNAISKMDFDDIRAYLAKIFIYTVSALRLWVALPLVTNMVSIRRWKYKWIASTAR